MFAHKEISHKVRGPACSENARYLLVWVYRERCVHILYAFLAYYTVSVLILHRESLSSSATTPCHVLIGQNVANTSKSKSWWGLDCDLRPNAKKMKPEFQLGPFLWKARVTMSTLASLLFKGLATKHTTVNWTNIYYYAFVLACG